ncbi:hypothetical protein CMO90_04425 [Candidatus Woesearchaeota archaeon]|jgi:hypothetical protein|nr:hypothetical protein [Candidatus Woesearchaeota archaeon]|tara:strand:- start:1013 stop:1366 length:354 start_codon:yes stop_codon:yes gene_type:complete
MIKKINLKTKYETKIYGLGEVYEIISIEKLRKKLLKKYVYGILVLSDKNIDYKKPLLKGTIDNPPWKSNKINKEKWTVKIWPIKVTAKVLFHIMVFFEIFRKQKKAHMKYVFYQDEK